MRSRSHQRKSERKGAGRKRPAPFSRLHLHKPPAGGLVQAGLPALDFHQVPAGHLPGSGEPCPGKSPGCPPRRTPGPWPARFSEAARPRRCSGWPPLPRIVSGGRCLSCGHNSSQMRMYVRCSAIIIEHSFDFRNPQFLGQSPHCIPKASVVR